MNATLKLKGKKSINYYMRVLHRDIGFFIAGLIIIYALSGIVLIFRDTEFLKSEIKVEKKLTPNMEPSKVGEALRLRDFKVTKTVGDIISFQSGTYNTATGVAVYTSKDIIFPFNKFIGLHKAISKTPTHWFNLILGILLIFMAISSFWMFKPANKNFRRGLYFAGSGVVFVIILLLV